MLRVEHGLGSDRMSHITTEHRQQIRTGRRQMSFVTTQAQALTAAADQLATIGSAMMTSNSAVAEPTTGLAPATADEVSALTATAFAAHGVLYQEVSAQADGFPPPFVAPL